MQSGIEDELLKLETLLCNSIVYSCFSISYSHVTVVKRRHQDDLYFVYVVYLVFSIHGVRGFVPSWTSP
jgi:hypothetical protein